MVSQAPNKGVRGPASHKFWDLLHTCAHGMRNSNQTSHRDVRKIFTGPTTPPIPWLKVLVTRMLTRDLFAVADLLVM